MQAVDQNENVRAVIIRGSGKSFSSGLDLMDASSPDGIFAKQTDPSKDVGRRAVVTHKIVMTLQDCLSAAVKCRVPVIAAIHGNCIGAGIDLSSACDIRLSTASARFTVRETDIGMAADVGTLQRLPKIVSNHSWVRDICYTARFWDGNEAKEYGYVDEAYSTEEELFAAALKLAKEIATKSPVAIYGVKKTLNYTTDHSVHDGLQMIAMMNGGLVQTDDLQQATMAAMSKEKPKFAKL